VPYTVWVAFNQFRETLVDLDPNVSGTARNSRDYLVQQIVELGRTDREFPKLTGNYIPYGSFARKTKIQPLNDIDLLILLNGMGTSAVLSPNGGYNYWLKIRADSAPLAIFPDESGYVNSTKILNKLKSALASVPNYRKADIKKSMQAVTLDLASYSWAFDIVPAVPIATSGQSETLYYLIPNGRGDWIRTDPRKDGEAVSRVNRQHDGELLPIIRLLKYWNNRVHKPRLESYYFEAIVLKVFDYASKITDLGPGIKYFFDFAPSYLLMPCADPKGLGPNLDADLSNETKLKVQAAMQEAAGYAQAALLAKSKDDDKTAIALWQAVFGQGFPKYGS